MGPRLFILIIVLCVLSMYESESNLDGHSIMIIERKDLSPDHVKLTCECDKDVTMDVLNVSMPTVWDIFANKAPCDLDKFPSNARICKLLEKCENCIAEMEQCELKKVVPRDELNWDCRAYTKNLASSRQRRTSGSCLHPKSLGESILKSTFYHSGVKITQKCKYGFTLSNGISRVYRCRYNENVWFPEELPFEACQPFIHCEMTLKYHGTAKCVTAIIDVPPVCQVSCPHYEDHPAAESTSKCDIDGLWKPELPHCAKPVGGDDLVAAPEIKLHHLEEEKSKGLGETKKKLVEEQ